MSDFLDWIQQPWVQIVGWTLGAIGWIVGIVSGVLQVKGYRQQQRLDGAYQAILEQAQRDWRAKYTEEQVRDLTGQIVQLQQRIAEDVPKEARRVFLDDQLDALSESLGQSYERYVDLAAQRQTLSGRPAMPSPIMQSIEDAILPAYLERQKRQRAQHRLIAAIFLLSVLPFMFAAASVPFFAGIPIGGSEYPVGVLAVFLISTAGLVYLGRGILGARLNAWSVRRPIVYKITVAASWFVTLPVLGLFFLLTSEWTYRRPPELGPVLVGIGIVAAIFGGTLLLTSPSAVRLVKTLSEARRHNRTRGAIPHP